MIRYRIRDNMIKSCEIKGLFDMMAKDVFVTKDNRYIGSLPDIEL